MFMGDTDVLNFKSIIKDFKIIYYFVYYKFEVRWKNTIRYIVLILLVREYNCFEEEREEKEKEEGEKWG